MNDTSEVDSVAPWTIKAVAVETRQTVIRAAKQEGCSVGQWLERRVREWTSNGSPISSPSTTSPAEWLALTQAAALLAEHRETMPKGLRANLARGLREAARERTAPQPARKLIGHTELETEAN